MGIAAAALKLSAKVRKALEQVAARKTSSQRSVQRARVLLDAAAGYANAEIAVRNHWTRVSVIALRSRFGERGLDVLEDAPRPGRPKCISDALVAEVVEAVRFSKPKHATHWTRRALAAKYKISHSSIDRILHEHRLQPERVEHFKFSNDPQFAEKVRDIVGLYMAPPRNALVFCVDEKSQIQALERTAPILPLQRAIPERQSHDYWRNGTTTLFAALNVLDGTVLGKCLPRHRNDEFIVFLNHIEKSTPADLDIHLILDNYATHKHANVKAWLAAHPRYHVHFTPTSSSWLNLVERFFAEITNRRIRRGSFESVRNLIKAIDGYIANRNRDPQKFTWTKSAKTILRKVAKSKAIYETGH